MRERIVIEQALSALQAKGLDRLEAQLLTLHVLGLNVEQRSWLLTHNADQLDAQQWERLQSLAQRRLNQEPMAYLTGSQAFYGLTLQVSPQVLVPRPDTETLVDWALERIPKQGARVLDLGTGSGAIALAIKSQRPGAEVFAVDCSATALAVARNNAQGLGLAVTFYAGDWYKALPSGTDLFDCVVANPPYIAQNDRHLRGLWAEPQGALISGADGLDDLRQIITGARRHLRPGAWLLLEHGHEQASAVRNILLEAGLTDAQSRHDIQHIERCSGARAPLEDIPT